MKSFGEWLEERLLESVQDKGILLFNFEYINQEDEDLYYEIQSKIQREDIYFEQGNPGDFGLEKSPHITLLYGIVTKELQRGVIQEIFKNQKPIPALLDKISLFENKDFDVLKFDVFCPDVLGIRSRVERELPNIQTFEGYNPHVTIGYLHEGEGKKYLEKIKGIRILITSVSYFSGGRNSEEEKIEFNK